MKLKEKKRDGAKVTKKYDEAKTPYRRALESDAVSNECKRRLKEEYAGLNPAQLKRDITRLQSRLIKLSASKRQSSRNRPEDDQYFEYIFDEATNKSVEYISK